MEHEGYRTLKLYTKTPSPRNKTPRSTRESKTPSLGKSKTILH
jgi:hypothetical protein